MRKKTAFVLTLLFSVFLSAFSSCVPEPLPAEKQRLLVYGAVLAEKNAMGYTTLFDKSDGFLEACRQSLADAWSITDADSAKETLTWLLETGMREETDEYYNVDELLAIASGTLQTDEKTLKYLKNTIESYKSCAETLKEEYRYTDTQIATVKTAAAWDWDRMVTLSRWCYACGYLTEDETWELISRAKARADKSYGSWEEYFAGAAFGRALSVGGGLSEPVAAEKLLNGDESPYKLYAFGE